MMKSDTSPPPGPTVLVVGGSGGIGSAVCREFATARWRVAVHYHARRTNAEKVLADMAAAGTEGVLCRADVRDSQQVTAMVRDILARWNGLDALICAAGVAPSGLLLRLPESAWQDTLETNVTGVFHCLQAVGAHMVSRRGGSIVVIGSFAGAQGRRGQAAYAAAKAALLGLIRSAAAEWGDARVRVNLVLPGWHRTDLSADVMPAEGAFTDHLLGSPPPLSDVARAIRQLTELPGASGQVWNLDSRLL